MNFTQEQVAFREPVRRMAKPDYPGVSSDPPQSVAMPWIDGGVGEPKWRATGCSFKRD